MAYVEIPLTKGYTTLIDCADAPLALQYNWHLNDMGYAVWRGVKDGKKQTIRLHRLIAQTPDDLVTDHINHDTLDNRRANLRAVTQLENMNNLTRTARGYWFEERRKHWVVEIKDKYIGSFKTEKEAQEIVELIKNGGTYDNTIPKPTHCPVGHSLTDAYVYNNTKVCKPCKLKRGKEWREKIHHGRK